LGKLDEYIRHFEQYRRWFRICLPSSASFHLWWNTLSAVAVKLYPRQFFFLRVSRITHSPVPVELYCCSRCGSHIISISYWFRRPFHFIYIIIKAPLWMAFSVLTTFALVFWHFRICLPSNMLHIYSTITCNKSHYVCLNYWRFQ
jgi:hypothetical protein